MQSPPAKENTLTEPKTRLALTARDACRKETMSRRSFLRAVADVPEWCDQYNVSLTARADSLADQLIHIADGADSIGSLIQRISTEAPDLEPKAVEALARGLSRSQVERDRLRVHAREWLSSRLFPRRYGAQSAPSSAGEPTTIRVVFDPLPMPVAVPYHELPDASFEVIE